MKTLLRSCLWLIPALVALSLSACAVEAEGETFEAPELELPGSTTHKPKKPHPFDQCLLDCSSQFPNDETKFGYCARECIRKHGTQQQKDDAHCIDLEPSASGALGSAIAGGALGSALSRAQ